MTGILGELMGRECGLMRGKGGSMHLTSVEHGAMGSYAIIGAHLPIATGAAWSAQYRGTKQAAVTTLILGLTVGFALFLIDTKQIAGREWISDPRFGLGIPFMLQAVYMFCIWSVVYVVVSLLTPAPTMEQVERTTWSRPWAVITQGKLRGLTDARAIAVALLVLMAVLYLVFN